MTNTIELTQSQREALIHMLGMGKHIHVASRGYRNQYCASVGGEDEKQLTAMAELGLVRRGGTINEGTSVYFFATEAGMDAIGMTKTQKKRAMGD